MSRPTQGDQLYQESEARYSSKSSWDSAHELSHTVGVVLQKEPSGGYLEIIYVYS